MGLNSSFPFVEWKPLRRLSSRRRQVLRVVHGLRMSQQEQVETREVQTGNKEKKKITMRTASIGSAERLCVSIIGDFQDQTGYGPEQSGLLDNPALSRKLD